MKYKASKIYNLANEYIQEMVKHDMVGVIGKYNKRFYDIFYKSLEVTLKQTMTPEMIRDLILIAKERLIQSRHFESFSRISPSKYDYDEPLVRKYYREFIEKLEELQ
jgi:hypothetical protein